MKDAAIAGVAPARIVDARRKSQLARVVLEILPPDEPRFEAAARIHHFLADELSLTPDTNALVGVANTLVTRLSGGLATWARRLEFEPFRLRVIATAGAGKTQLAVRVMRDALAQGKSVLYVCFNRPLAEHIRAIAPKEAKIANYHQLSAAVARDAGSPPDFSRPDVFATLEERFVAVPVPAHWKTDVLIVDEGQDFQAAWVEALERLLNPEGAWWWLEDPMQNLYLREPVPLPGWTILRETTNYRNPRDLLDFIRKIVGPGVRLDAGSPFDGSEVTISTYEDGQPEEIIEATKRAITQALSLGFRKQDIAVLSFRGREGSALTAVDQLGPHRLRAFTGTYDLFGTRSIAKGMCCSNRSIASRDNRRRA
ncbi:Superfamily I DNA and RNA helicase [Candidatus Paraburkholderia kirkii]|nr:Superfamily I DNA and RNA helicase [Candidatus Paraburkholderia kirkii]